eukprot:SAG31_NODE_3096_length_4680_cov_1.703995_6_plen_98_part_00
MVPFADFNGIEEDNVRDLTYRHVFCNDLHYNPNATIPNTIGIPADAHRKMKSFTEYCGEGSLLPWVPQLPMACSSVFALLSFFFSFFFRCIHSFYLC